MRESFDQNWRFFLGDPEGAEKPLFSDEVWRILNLPHDWSIEGAFDENNPTGGSGGYLPAGTGWYRKGFILPLGSEGKRICIEFDGVYMNCCVWVNGRLAGSHVYGYTGFFHDITPFLKYDGSENIIAVRVDNSEQPNSRWYTGSGIYRHTWLTFTDSLHVDHWGMFVRTTKITGSHAVLKVETMVRCGSEKDRTGLAETAVLKTIVLDGRDAKVSEQYSEFSVEPGGSALIDHFHEVPDPCLWSVEKPYLYRVESYIIKSGDIKDSCETGFGIRKISFDADKGFLLNDSRMKVNGVCIHHDCGCIGAAVPERVWERRLEILKEMGCNAIRMSHNPPSPELLDMCDRMGFLVMDEAFDEWRISKEKSGKTDYGYFKYFDNCFEDDLRSMLRRDRNHPSIILWSVGNEIPEQCTPDGAILLKRLVGICREEDPSRPVTSACDNIKAQPSETTDEFLGLLDVVGYNYVGRWQGRTETLYADDHHRYPDRKIIGSENYSSPGIRGDYSLTKAGAAFWQQPYQARMMNAEHLWKFTSSYDYVAGDFMWTGIDYLGEAHWPYKGASSGMIDTCGFPKDGFYFYQARWTGHPVLHLFPHWNWEGCEGRVIPVLCHTNCDSVELFLNGKSLGIKSFEFPRQGMTERFMHFDKPYVHVTTSDLHLSWDVPYEPGELSAVGYKYGEVVCEERLVTAGKPARLELAADKGTVFADGRDVCHITARIFDQKGNICPVADNSIEFGIEGEGYLIGIDNGKPDSHESYKANKRNAFNGLCLAIVQSTSKPGRISVSATSKGLTGDGVSIAVLEAKLENNRQT